MPRRTRAALSPEAREQQLIAMAYDLAERRMAEGKASSQEIVYLMRLGSSREAREQKRIEQQTGLMSAKTKSIESTDDMNRLYLEAINAMREYGGDNGGQNDPDVY